MIVAIFTVVLAISVQSVDVKHPVGSQRSVCTGVRDGTYIADEASCSNFFVCYNNEPVSQSCKQGSYFDATNLYCLPDTDNICPVTECKVNGVYSAYPGNCYLFYICYDGKLVEQICQSGSYFNETELYCLPDINNICPQPQCSTNGEYSANPVNCSSFFVCYNGKLVEQSCEPGSYFDETELYCLPDTNNTCPANQCEDGEFISNPTNCSSFYVCYKGRLVEQSCEPGSYFNETKLYCLPDTNNTCPANQCKNGEFISNPTNCSSFYVCYEGRLVEQSCEPGSYFNETELYCLPDTNNTCPENQCKNEEFISNPTNCSSFYVCYEGRLVEQSCEPGSYFDETELYCLPDTNNTCPANQCEDGEFIPNPSNCSSFYVCYEGRLVEQSCEPGSYFNKTELYCLPDTNNTCPANQCEDGEFISNPSNCSSFYVCYEGRLVEQSCEPGSYFNETELYCLPDTNNTCPANQCEDGEFISNPSNCSSFYVCYEGKLVEQSCEPGSYFNETELYCLPDKNNTCPANQCEDGEFVSNPTNCSSFYVCYEGRLVEQSCEPGSYFDETELYCLPDTNNTCPANQCGDGEFISNPTNCSSFYVCYEGRLVEQSCEPGSYFDETELYCLPDTNNTCPANQCEDGEFIPNPSNCSSFYVCYKGQLVEQSCEPGSYFDETELYCLPDTNSTCPANQCEDGEFISNPTNCSSFYVCYEGRLVEQSCEPGSYFDETELYCLPDTNNTCPAYQCDDGEFIPNPSNCSSFYVCYKGQLVEQSCEPGSYFDETELYCLPDTNSTCPANQCEDGEFISNPTNCSSFYVCYEGRLVEQSCDPGSYFDETELYCLPDTNNTCPANQCDDGEFIPNPSNCSSFYVCHEGQLVEQSCEPGSYFDETELYCLPDTNSTCPANQCEDGEFISNPTNCSSFYVCYEGRLVEQSCEPGSYFDETELYCLPDTNNTCPANQCEDGEFIPNPSNCSSFYVCYEGRLVEQSCEPGSYFNETELYCLPDTNNTCPANQCEDGEFISNPSNCSSFYVCYEGRLVEQSCEPGSYFDETELYCLPDTNNTCPANKCKDGDFIPNPLNCSSFYVCYEGELVEQSCDPGSYFDETELYCLPDTNNTCPAAQCTSDGEFIPHPTNCSLFYICSNGMLVEQSCGPGSYFDLTELYCLPDTNNTCPSLQCTVNGEIRPHPTECASFLVCYNGLLVEQNCGCDSYFDKLNLYCVPDTDNVCWPPTSTTPEDPCTCDGGYADGEFIPNAESCYLYYICSGGVLVELNCGNGNYFNNCTKTCERDDDGECWPIESTTTTTTESPACICPGGYEEGALVGNSDSCSAYFICSGGELIAQSCGTGNYFDVNSKSCVRDEEGTCWPTTTTPSPAPCICPGGYEEGALVGNSDSCSAYFICSAGELIAQSCGTGNYFDVNSKSCVRDEERTCWPTTTIPSPAPCLCPGGYEEGALVGNSDICSAYFICSAGELIAQSCGTGNYFDVNSKSCLRDEEGTCWPTTTTPSPAPCLCPGGYEEGALVGNSDSCSAYFICSAGELIAQSCGTGNYFDVNSKSCVRDEEGTCWPTTTTPSPAPCLCPGGYEEAALVGNSDSCSAYFICSGGELIAQSCGTGNYFDVNSKSCVRDEEGTCWPTTTTPSPAPCLCPGGYEEGALVGNSDSCSAYFICSGGELIAQTCGTGNYFDVNSKSCMRDEDGICWPKMTNTVQVHALCPGGYEEGALVWNRDNCFSYFACKQGKLMQMSCGNGNYFDAYIKACLRDENGSCWPTQTNLSLAASVCPGGYEEGALISDRHNCSSYWVCSQGELIAQSCGLSYYFDVSSRNCVLDATGICWPTAKVSSPCPGGYREGDLIEDTESCGKYFLCSQGRLLSQNCGPGFYFDTNFKVCVRDKNRTCEPTKVSSQLCPSGHKDGDFVYSSSSCSAYSVCLQGQLIDQSCGIGNYFEVSSGNCVRDTNGVCWPNTSETPLCSGEYEEGDFVAKSGSCHSYFLCHKGELIAQSCGTGYYFDKLNKNCERDINATCWPVQVGFV